MEEHQFKSHEERFVEYILANSTTPDLQYAYLPGGLNPSEIAAYLLIVASVNQGARAESIGEYVQDLWITMGRNLFQIGSMDPNEAKRLVNKCLSKARVSRSNPFDDVTVIRTAASYINSVGDFCKHAQSFQSPAGMVEDLVSNISHFGRLATGARKKAWMYMRWMVRPHPDLRLFLNFHPRDLEIPLDVNTCKAFTKVMKRFPSDPFLLKMNLDEKGIPIADAQNRHHATCFARSVFPDDPIIMDYPLFLLGRQRSL